MFPEDSSSDKEEEEVLEEQNFKYQVNHYNTLPLYNIAVYTYQNIVATATISGQTYNLGYFSKKKKKL